MPQKTELAQRIKRLRIDAGLTQTQLAEQTGLSYVSIRNYENSIREPNSKAMVVLENFFSVSGAYLRGETDDRQRTYKWDDDEDIEIIASGFPQQLTNLAKLLDTRTELEQKMVFDILVELRHVLASKYLSDIQKQATLLLLQEMFSTSTFFADACASATLDQPKDKERLEKGRQDAADKAARALTTAMENITQEQLTIE